MSERACRTCSYLTTANVCPLCKGQNLADKWKGFVIIIDPGHSEIARKMSIKTPGKYALKV